MINLKSNNSKKAISFVIALMLWSYVMGDINPESSKTLVGMGLEVVNVVDDSLVVVSDTNIKIDATLSGKRNDINTIKRENLSFYINLSEYGEGTHEVDVASTFISDNVELRYQPSTIEVVIEKVVEKEMPVELTTVGNFPTGMDKNNLIPDAEKVAVSGQKTQVESVVKLESELNVNGIKENETRDVRIRALDRNGKEVEGIKLSKNNLKVNVKEIEGLTVEVKPKIIGTLSEGYRLIKADVNYFTINLKKIDKTVDNIQEVPTEGIDITGLTEDTTVETKIEVPRGYEMLEDYKIEVEVKIEKTEDTSTENNGKQTLDYLSSNIAISGLDDTLTVSNTGEFPKTIRINTTNSPQGIDVSSIKLGLNLLDIKKEGEYTRNILITNSNMDTKGISLTPNTIKIVIAKKK